MSEAKCPECDLAQHRGDCFDDEIDARLSKSLRAEVERLKRQHPCFCAERDLFKARAEKAEAEVERLKLERGTTVATAVALREELDKRDEGVRFWQSGCDIANEARVKAEARAEKLAAALRELHGRLALCHGALMGYGCSGQFHNPRCATAAALAGEEKKR